MPSCSAQFSGMATGEGRIEYFDIRRGQLPNTTSPSLCTASARPAPAGVGLLSPLLAPRNVTEPRDGLSFLEELKRAYDVVIIPHFADALPPDLDVLLVIDATVLKREMLYAIDQHVMAGHGLIAMMDPQVRFNRASNIVTRSRPRDQRHIRSPAALRCAIRRDPKSSAILS
jgi:ABC-2 type transport system permease protein